METSILFVDDDAQLLQGLKRSLRKQLVGCDLYFANSGQEALEILPGAPISLIISDMRMPGMTGGQLLEIVSQKYPHIIRFILSGHVDHELALISTRIAHQFIAKPVDTTELVETIKRSFQLRDLQSDSQLIAIVNSIQKLPSLPSLYIDLVHETESENASANSIANIISKDITMTAKILQIINSAFYGLPNRISNLPQAVSYLGMNTLKSLVLGEQVFSEFQKQPDTPISIDQLWNHSLMVGVLARNITQDMQSESRLNDDSQVAGLMHDIGKLIQVNIAGFYQEMDKKIKSGIPPLAAEYEIINTSHAELGAYLLGIWGLPDPIVQAVAYHHHPSRQNETKFSVLTAVHVANSFLSMTDEEIFNNGDPPLDLDYLDTINATEFLPLWKQKHKKMIEKTSSN